MICRSRRLNCDVFADMWLPVPDPDPFVPCAKILTGYATLSRAAILAAPADEKATRSREAAKARRQPRSGSSVRFLAVFVVSFVAPCLRGLGGFVGPCEIHCAGRC